MGIVHRDLKPENLLLSSKDPAVSVVKITDFGLSKLMGRRRFLESRCGTPAYASPEILRAEP
jgi:serine/threonine protein kinase